MIKSRIAKGVFTLALPLLAAFAVPAAANAAPAPAHSDFSAQAKTAGLTASQSTGLQAKVDRYLSEMGGTQTAANRIDLNGTGVVSVTVPGEARPRSLATSAAPDVDPCYDGEGIVTYGHFCAYNSPTRGQGDSVDMFHCTSYSLPGWTGLGSWINNQTTGTRARFYGRSGNLLYTTPGASTFQNNYNWTPVWTIRPC